MCAIGLLDELIAARVVVNFLPDTLQRSLGLPPWPPDRCAPLPARVVAIALQQTKGEPLVPGELKSSQPTNESLCCDLAAPASRFRVGVRGWPAFLVWSGPRRPSIPKPLPYPLRPSMRPGSGSSGRGSECPARLCACHARGGGASHHRYGVKGIGDQKELADGVVQFLAANYRHGRKRRQAAQAALPGIMAADSGDCVPAPQQWLGLLEISHR